MQIVLDLLNICVPLMHVTPYGKKRCLAVSLHSLLTGRDFKSRQNDCCFLELKYRLVLGRQKKRTGKGIKQALSFCHY